MDEMRPGLICWVSFERRAGMRTPLDEWVATSMRQGRAGDAGRLLKGSSPGVKLLKSLDETGGGRGETIRATGGRRAVPAVDRVIEGRAQMAVFAAYCRE